MRNDLRQCCRERFLKISKGFAGSGIYGRKSVDRDRRGGHEPILSENNGTGARMRTKADASILRVAAQERLRL
jgi:hypothetical protein